MPSGHCWAAINLYSRLTSAAEIGPRLPTEVRTLLQCSFPEPAVQSCAAIQMSNVAGTHEDEAVVRPIRSNDSSGLGCQQIGGLNKGKPIWFELAHVRFFDNYCMRSKFVGA